MKIFFERRGAEKNASLIFRMTGRLVFCLSAVFVLLISGCPDTGGKTGNNETGTGFGIAAPDKNEPAPPDNFYGEWVNVKARWGYWWSHLAPPAAIYVTSENSDGLTRLSNNVIQKGEALYYPVRIANSKFSGNIAKVTAGRAIGSNLGGVKVAISNLNDQTEQTQERTTDSNGNFDASEIIAGDVYEITVEGQTFLYRPGVHGEYVGTFTITLGKNIKASVTEAAFEEELYAGMSYEGPFITLTNTSTETVNAGAKVTAAFDAGLSNGGSKTAAWTLGGDIAPGKSRNLSLSKLTCTAESIEGDYALKNVRLQITDGNDIYLDTVSVRFFKKSLYGRVKIPMLGPLCGFIVSPLGTTTGFVTNWQESFWEKGIYVGEFTVPYLTDGNYTLGFCGGYPDTETKYSFALYDGNDKPGYYPESDNLLEALNSFDGNTNLYEPNDTEQTSTALPGTEVTSYLGVGDMDYYKFKLSK